VLAVAAVALLLLLGVAWWYNARLQAAMRNLDRQHAAAERNLERMRLLLETTRRLVGVTDHGELLRLLGETTALLCDAERATIFLLDRERGELWSRMMLVDEGEIRVPLGVGVAGTAAVTGETINVPDAYADPRFNPEVDRRTGFRTRNLFTVPMTGRDGKVLGVFQVVNKRGGAFTQEDAEMLFTLAASAALAVENTHGVGP
jgi:GAF domain-containing protein